MEHLWDTKTTNSSKPGGLGDPTQGQRDLETQTIISVVFGLSAFFAFCFLRPRWTSLYAARKKQKNEASRLPDLPDTFFGWIPVLYNISEEEVLASAGLDAFVFLAFFRMATKYLTFVLFFSLTVIYPVHKNFNNNDPENIIDEPKNGTTLHNASLNRRQSYNLVKQMEKGDLGLDESPNYLWIYVVFVYLFSLVALYMIVKETKRIIGIRQRFLGTHSSVTDRTIRLSGIPVQLRSEDKITETIENLEIGKVESVMLCRNWKELDDLVSERRTMLRKLEEAWTVHLGYHRAERASGIPLDSRSHGPESRPNQNGEDEQSGLLNGNHSEQAHVTHLERDRPTTRIWFGYMNLQSKRIDAIDYYEEKLRKLDEKIVEARQKKFPPTPLAFVTLDSIAACQMAVQAILDPVPMQLMASAAPAPSDLVWKNTYLSRRERMIRAWSITAVILVLTILWSFLLIPLAGLLNLETINKVLPGLATLLEGHKIIRSLVQTGLPTLVISLLNVAVPYLYDYLSNRQGMTSQADVEMSVISKNFFFTFFNFFVVFTVFGTFSNVVQAYESIGDRLKDVSSTAKLLAKALALLTPFYTNFIILQGLGLFPFRLLEFGSVALYPIFRIGAKTPRDYAELVQPPVFSYGFYLPQTLLIFIICIVYSVLPKSELLIIFGLIYFVFGSIVHKYQLLYAMDHRRHSTGRAWPIICNRVVVGLIVFQLAMTGELALQSAWRRSVLVLPLLVGTIWFAYFYRKTYEPLMKFIALRSLIDEDDAIPLGESRYDAETDHGRAVDESEETGLRFINPSLTTPLEDVWINGKRRANGTATEENV